MHHNHHKHINSNLPVHKLGILDKKMINLNLKLVLYMQTRYTCTCTCIDKSTPTNPYHHKCESCIHVVTMLIGMWLLPSSLLIITHMTADNVRGCGGQGSCQHSSHIYFGTSYYKLYGWSHNLNYS